MRASAKLVRSASARNSTCSAFLLARAWGASAVTIPSFGGSGGSVRVCAEAPAASAAASTATDPLVIAGIFSLLVPGDAGSVQDAYHPYRARLRRGAGTAHAHALSPLP